MTACSAIGAIAAAAEQNPGVAPVAVGTGAIGGRVGAVSDEDSDQCENRIRRARSGSGEGGSQPGGHRAGCRVAK
jgi:hypothetical protein